MVVLSGGKKKKIMICTYGEKTPSKLTEKRKKLRSGTIESGKRKR